MSIIKKYTQKGMRLITNLDKLITYVSDLEREDTMPLNTSKIRRQVQINGNKVWISAKTEQDYVDKVLRIASISGNQSTHVKHNFKEYAYTWFEVFSKPNVSSVTSINYKRQLDLHILPILGDKNLEDITPADVQKIFNALDENTKQESKNKIKNVVNQIFNLAIDDGLIFKNPLKAASVRIKGSASVSTKPYTVEQMRFLVSHLVCIQNQTARAWLALSISLPLRPEEVLGLTWADVDEINEIIHVRNTVTHPNRNQPEFKPYTKTESSARDLRAPHLIFSYLPKRGKDSEFVLGGDKPLSYTQVKGLRRRIAADTHFSEPIVPRRFRTTVATDISATTHDLKLVQQMLGHATPQMTLKHYDKGRKNAIDASNAISECYGLADK